ncbi:sphingoid long-chain bases kinase 2, mitochondrial-like isoform X12 [Nymphaea colorata]|uniref:sphingoid long-chain bases kinase 2, mitochondrial-like isoform X12 n=2 Tax=Nymphaea colorata TaxID=210225 RepID=UPI00129E4F70|nr:sphingoid long-chain bases kinase 2, mitochondrial-like isoform X12 [Nymphaea colorata]
MALPNQSKLIIQTSNWSLLVMAELAIKEGMDAVIAVGGDGCEWLLLGWKACPGKGQGDKCKTALGLIPLGTGSDFARTFGWKNDPNQAIDCIAAFRLKANLKPPIYLPFIICLSCI